MTLRLLAAGQYTLIVDLGRPAYRSLGVPLGGAADRAALAIGNALVGNPPDTAALEISLAGPTLETDGELACVVYGAPFTLHSDRQQSSPGKTFTLHPGERLEIGGTTAGMRAYFCVAGGLEAPVVLGSRSGLQPLRAGAELPCSPGRIGGRFVLLGPEKDCPWSPHGPLASPVTLRVLDGAQSDWLPDALQVGREWEVTPASNRMGLRLRGAPLSLPQRELVSEPVCPGTVQVTRDGQCIILGVDGQTIGGYPKIAQVISADLDLLGQLRPGDRVRMQRVTLEEAEEAFRRRQAALREWVARLRATEPRP